MEGACKEEKCLKGGGRRGKGGNICLLARYLERRASVCLVCVVVVTGRKGKVQQIATRRKTVVDLWKRAEIFVCVHDMKRRGWVRLLSCVPLKLGNKENKSKRDCMCKEKCLQRSSG